MQLRFSHKILLAGCSIVILVFSLFALYNDYLQRKSIRSNLEFSMDQAGGLTAGSVQNWLDGRLLLLQNLASNLANRSAPSDQLELIDQPAFTSNFLFTYLGGADGSFIQTPDEDDLPEDYDPRTRPWYTGSAQARGIFLTEPYQDTTGVLVITMSAPVTRYGQLAAATEEKPTVDEALNKAHRQINELNQQSVATHSETQQDCDALSHQASRLKQLVDSFRI